MDIRALIGQMQAGANKLRNWQLFPDPVPIVFEKKSEQMGPAGMPTPMPTPQPVMQPQVKGASTSKNGGRNPYWEQWKRTNPKAFEELFSGTGIASQETGIPQDLLMDISGIETSGGQNLIQKDKRGNVVPNGGQGYYQWEQPTLKSLGSNIDPMSATESARLAAQEIAKGMLSRWGTPQATNPLDKNWGSFDNPKNRNGSLVDWYSPDELNPYLAPKFRSQW